MPYSKPELWRRFQDYYTEWPSLRLALDLSRMNFSSDFFARIDPQLQKALDAMADLESGAIANPDEQRMVGHYWLRNPALAPTAEIRKEIEDTVLRIKAFAAQVHAAGRFENLLLIGIGGSVLGPQFVARALGWPGTNQLEVHFFDNTDPDGMDRTFAELESRLGSTLCVVVSKSGGTRETRNGMLEAREAFERAGLNFSEHAVAITRPGSDLDKYALQGKWIDRFPMWDWVGGRTSELSAVGLLPAALQGLDIDSLLEGARACDEITRSRDWRANPSSQLAAMWHHSGNGNGTKNMIVLPYKDRLELFSKYLQQLVMESLGKRLDLDGKVVNQGLTVFGNKGSTDQHAYIQQLRDGPNDFFVTFIEVLRDREPPSIMVEPDVTSGDYLNGLFQGTREALAEDGRESITITVNETSAFTVGALIALFERAVGLYASLINVNAYHQPGVEAGKRAATAILSLQKRVLEFLRRSRDSFTASQIAEGLGLSDDRESIFKLCEHLAANPDRGIMRTGDWGPLNRRYAAKCDK